MVNVTYATVGLGCHELQHATQPEWARESWGKLLEWAANYGTQSMSYKALRWFVASLHREDVRHSLVLALDWDCTIGHLYIYEVRENGKAVGYCRLLCPPGRCYCFHKTLAAKTITDAARECGIKIASHPYEWADR